MLVVPPCSTSELAHHRSTPICITLHHDETWRPPAIHPSSVSSRGSLQRFAAHQSHGWGHAITCRAPVTIISSTFPDRILYHSSSKITRPKSHDAQRSTEQHLLARGYICEDKSIARHPQRRCSRRGRIYEQNWPPMRSHAPCYLHSRFVLLSEAVQRSQGGGKNHMGVTVNFVFRLGRSLVLQPALVSITIQSRALAGSPTIEKHDAQIEYSEPIGHSL